MCNMTHMGRELTNAELADEIERAMTNGWNATILVQLARSRGVARSVPLIDIPCILRRFPTGPDGKTEPEWLREFTAPW